MKVLFELIYYNEREYNHFKGTEECTLRTLEYRHRGPITYVTGPVWLPLSSAGIEACMPPIFFSLGLTYF